ncbi:S1/P1 nuclease [Daejeonella lutea]|uniref:S1/P1 Nuclease n=1 Tax=Daejeonella lutea TaxID=572036 RepID=A0A1T5DL13_9SPHI|nr:S1/P1 nuclease [Daejeonella lutea]SKB72402.1 S1/P1 Nuclease [Daejeonella lutea]
MLNNKSKKIILVAFLAYLPISTMAWGLLGHRVVGEIAESYLKRRTSREIKEILGNETLAMASNWGDFIKSEPAYKYLDNWHYINLKSGISPDELKAYLAQDTVTDVYTRIQFLSKELRDKSLSQDKKQMYLRLLIHFVGDIHQPMHAAHPDDLGGGRFQVTWFGQPTNLHRVWDSDMVEDQKLSYTEYARAINFIDNTRLKQLQGQGLSEWVTESYVISEKIYANVKPGDKLSYRYTYDYIGIANDQMLKGGIHLASLLNDIFK